MIDSSSNISVSILTCFCIDCLSFSFKLYNFLHRVNLLAHVFFWTRSANFFQTTAGFSASAPGKYNSVWSTDSTIVAKARSLCSKYFACSPWFYGSFLFSVTIFHIPSFIRAIIHCTFQVVQFGPFNGLINIFIISIAIVSNSQRTSIGLYNPSNNWCKLYEVNACQNKPTANSKNKIVSSPKVVLCFLQSSWALTGHILNSNSQTVVYIPYAVLPESSGEYNLLMQ